ncbi:hypothetical protein P8C59_004382 [Phyllachora maydis]|uniref:tRNA(Ile)-lysidine synthetase n=1 Tax=Phyllachora maydis TaxID=1825666 RepID=A0AAD9I3B1_9PEZI|nr:hypothetical protein P8C59_004382 [Phyllachora maydis]
MHVALRKEAIAPPRFPRARGHRHRHRHRRLALGISGGVDSMALAFLCSQVKRVDPWVCVADDPVSSFLCVTVDHRLREGSTAEAHTVRDALRQLRLGTDVFAVNWADILGEGVDPNGQPNIESLARAARYRILGRRCRLNNIVSLLLAHHQDDQYETVLMRLLAGHAYRGLRGMRAAWDVPECYDMHGVFQSGFVDQQFTQQPYYDDFSLVPHPLPPMWVEDGGVHVYRPLLPFAKDRLMATCLENKVPWFDDATNKDPTLTMRNAVRHMHERHTLPVALQKPAILRLAERCQARAAREDAEAERLLARTVLVDFEPGVGTAMVEFPELSLPRPTAQSAKSAAGRAKRIAHYRLIAGLLVRRILSLVTPEHTINSAAPFDSILSRLFPALARPREDGAALRRRPKAFTHHHVHLIPVLGPTHPPRWFLARAPYPAARPHRPLPPRLTHTKLPLRLRVHRPAALWPLSGSPDQPAVLWDGRYWVRLRHRLPGAVTLAPLDAARLRAFRHALPEDLRALLAQRLKRYAPGKVRFTLPALYAAGHAEALVRAGPGAEYWPAEMPRHVLARARAVESSGESVWSPGFLRAVQRNSSSSSSSSSNDDITGTRAAGGFDAGTSRTRAAALADLYRARLLYEQELEEAAEMRLVALPTLGIRLPGLERWVECDVRYRKVDFGVLRLGVPDAWHARRRGGKRARPCGKTQRLAPC